MSGVLARHLRTSVRSIAGGTVQRKFDFLGVVPALERPLIKYAGAKNWLVKLLALRVHAHLVNVRGVYVEPFCGSIALGLAIGWPEAVYADTCADLVNLYQSLVTEEEEVAAEVDKLREVFGENQYYAIRESVWPEYRVGTSSPAWAARTIWLNKNCFNGLMRFSEKNGHFNVPWGKRKGVVLPSREHLSRVAAVLRTARIVRSDFSSVLLSAALAVDPRRLVVYLDPPYGGKLQNVSTRGARDRGGSSTGVFTGYTGKFTWEDQVRLADHARVLARRGSLVVATNSWTDEVCDLYRDGFALFQVGVRHSVGATGDRRGRRAEMLAVSEAHAGVVESVPAKIVRR